MLAHFAYVVESALFVLCQDYEIQRTNCHAHCFLSIVGDDQLPPTASGNGVDWQQLQSVHAEKSALFDGLPSF